MRARTPPETLRRAAAAIVLPTLLGCLTLLACGSSLRRADRLFEAGSYREAAAAYEEALGNGDGASGNGAGEVDRVLLRLALVHALPDSPVHDPARARAFFDQLMERYESGPNRSQAALMLDLDLTASSLREEVDRLRGEIHACRARLDELLAQAALILDLQFEASSLSMEAERLRGEANSCREQLEKLKAIDVDGSLR